jgi:hypothetical protein
MQSAVQLAPIPSKTQLWTGRFVSAIPVLAVVFAGAVKVMKAPGVAEGFAQSGIAARLIVPIGLIELTCAAIYVIPRTAVLGAILMTAFFGGATFSALRINDKSFILTIVLGVLVWIGLYLRDNRLRALVPLRSRQ